MFDIGLMSTAFIGGLLGGVHCVGMCGGIVGALSFGVDQQANNKRRVLTQILYNLGRITSYSIAGLIFGWIGALTIKGLASHTIRQYLQTFSGIFLILLGFYMANWWRILVRLEQAGGIIWRRIEPFARKLIPIKNARHAFLVGTVWGWLPCGLVYTMLTLSLTSAHPVSGALVMLSFGLGTFPALLAFGLVAVHLRNFLANPIVRSVAGLMVIGFGMYLLWSVWGVSMDHHAHHHHH